MNNGLRVQISGSLTSWCRKCNFAAYCSSEVRSSAYFNHLIVKKWVAPLAKTADSRCPAKIFWNFLPQLRSLLHWMFLNPTHPSNLQSTQSQIRPHCFPSTHKLLNPSQIPPIPITRYLHLLTRPRIFFSMASQWVYIQNLLEMGQQAKLKQGPAFECMTSRVADIVATVGKPLQITIHLKDRVEVSAAGNVINWYMGRGSLNRTFPSHN